MCEYRSTVGWLIVSTIGIIGCPILVFSSLGLFEASGWVASTGVFIFIAVSTLRTLRRHHTWWELTQIAGGGLVACVGLAIGLTFEHPVSAPLFAVGMIGLSAGFGLARLRVQSTTEGGAGMEEDGYTEQQLQDIRMRAIQLRKTLAVLAWIVAGLLACWSLYLFWVAGEAGALPLILASGLALTGGAIWQSHQQFSQSQLLEADDLRIGGAH